MTGFIGYAVAAFALVGLYRWLALRQRWLDHPNQRSSHTQLTPRGAGVIFALLIIAAAWSLRSGLALRLSLLAGLAVALAGWWDDVRGVSARARFLVYAASAVAAVALIATHRTGADSGAGGWPWLGGLIAAVALLWLINLYNFMDGINGIAACEALFVLLAIGWLARDTPYLQAFAALHVCGSAAVLGFLLWNFPAGKVFMGDAGSAFLGFFIGVLMLWSLRLGGPPLAVWLILLGVFIADSGYTLAVRIATGQRWYAAHRLHAYQLLTTRLGGSHARALAVLLAVNLGWLLPLAWLVQTLQLRPAWGMAAAYLPLLAACRWLKAGIPGKGGV